MQKTITIGILFAFLIGVVMSSTYLFENVAAGNICVIQSPVSGELTVYTEPGIKWQGFGRVTYYPRSGVYEFNQPVDPNDPSQEKDYVPHLDNSLKITFNDGGEAWVSGSIRYDYPLTTDQIIILHKMFSGHENVLKGLIEKTVERSVYMSGPLMSSIDSFMSRRADVPKVIEDQARYGLYDVVTKDVRIKDEFTGEEKIIKQAEPVRDPKAPNGLARQEDSVLSKYGMVLSNFTTNNISYSPRVQERVNALFAAASDIQLATLNAKKAEQDKRTAEERGKSDAVTAEWKAKTITAEETETARKIALVQKIDAERDKDVANIEANKKREVAEQEKITASLYKDAQLLRAEADATYKRKVMEADGALAQKLDAYKYAVDRFSNAIANYRGAWTPQIVTGNSGAGQNNNAAMNMMEFLSIKAAKDLGLEMGMATTEKAQ
ncbi:SPFH domain-containing protein [Desulfovibrio litoralis]|uniref:SPFH domain / Band 7 family protein n=1 Tax=Desulfovibrio litoralis DSM 11393 TaxID=1121455 RepID=A0A1M7RXD1_9BACT|nr:SPFH domain-containing protein [Desulfovibrio litoralis]SHN50943.1 SPFH domain / Band 7 family protein [Desulfovibrio litoralis DSM 11393]